MKHKLKIEFRVRGSERDSHYVSVDREFEVQATKGRLFQTLDSFEKILKSKYPIPVKMDNGDIINLKKGDTVPSVQGVEDSEVQFQLVDETKKAGTETSNTLLADK